MVLAAGFGTRLAPITDHVPKPLLPLGGGTLLDHAIAALRRGGVGEVAVNSHHLGAMIAAHLEGTSVHHFPEREILGTGGALAGARAFLAEADHFVVFNGDVLCDVDVADLISSHRAGGHLATLVLVDRPEINTVFVDAGQRVIHIRGAGPEVPGNALVAAQGLTYTGVAVFARRFLKLVPEGFGSLIDPLIAALRRQPGCVAAYRPREIFWDDLGDLTRYLRAQHHLEESPQRFRWLTPGAAGPLRCRRLRGHGSDRRFWRLSGPGFSAVALQSDRGEVEDDEFRRHREIGAFLRARDLGSAEVLAEDAAANTMLMEDLGGDTLHRLATRPETPPERLAAVYRLAVDHLLKLQAFTEEARAGCPPAVDRCLDQDALRAETTYFQERFLLGVHGLDAADDRLAALFAELARLVANQPLVLIHRDFQSQNIHLKEGRLRLVDYQGMRLGPLGYDLMSLVFDPYVDLPDALREDLLQGFCLRAGPAPEQVRCWALAAGLQRLMQALGAYGFLGLVRGKREFLAHIPRGLAHLAQVLALAHKFQVEHPETARGGLPGRLAPLANLVQRLLD